MKILYFFQEQDTPMFRWQRVHFIDELNRHGCEFDCINPLTFESAVEANEHVIHLLDSCRFDLFFTNVCYEKVLFPETLVRIKEMGIPSLCLRCDNLVIPFNDKVLAPYFDLIWLTSWETQFLYDKWGCTTFFAPYAANPFLFQYRNDHPITHKVCFIGTPYGSRANMINALTEGEIPIDLFYGNNTQSKVLSNSDVTYRKIQTPSRTSVLFHRLLFPQGRKVLLGTIKNRITGHISINSSVFLTHLPSVQPQDQGDLYSEYALALASTSTNHTDILRHPLKIINLRNFEIPMSGGIEICRYNPELADYFEDGKEIVFYKNNDELQDKARYYLTTASDYDIRSIKIAARKRAEGEHTWWQRFTKAFGLLGLPYSN